MNSSLGYALSACAVAVALAGCDPEDGAKELEQGRAAYELRDLNKAARLLERSAELSPTNVDTLVYLARTKLDQGDIAAARGWIGKAADLAGGDLDVRLMRAQLAWHAKEYDEAAKLFAGVAEESGLGAEACAQGWVGLGVVEMARERRDFARVAFLRAIRLDRKNAAAWYHLGLLYRDAFGYLESALEQFETFVRLEASASPKVQKVQRTTIPDLKEAIRRLTVDRPGVSKRDSAASAAALAKGEEAARKGAAKAALQHYRAALEADPLSYPAAIGLAKAQLRADASPAGRRAALESYRRACSIRHWAVSTFITAGALAANIGSYAQAVEIYSRAVAASPATVEAVDGLIRALQRVGGRQDDARAYQRYRDFLVANRKKK